MITKKLIRQTTIATLAIIALSSASQSAHADSKTVFLPSVQSNVVYVPDVTTLDELKACIKNVRANDACEIIGAMNTAYKKAGLGETVPYKIRNRSKGSDQSVYVKFDFADKSCQVGWHIQKDFWYSECKGPLYGDGGLDTVFVVPVPLDNNAIRFILAIGSEAGANRAGNIITYQVNEGFWIVDWYGQAHDGLCPIDNPYTEANESLCVH